MKAEILKLQNELASKVQQSLAIRDSNSELANRKGQSTQILLDLSECRTFLHAWLNTCAALVNAEQNVLKLGYLRDETLCELRSSSEEAFARQTELERLGEIRSSLHQQLNVAGENQDSLISMLSKLKSKHDTSRARANGAEAELLNTRRSLAEERSLASTKLSSERVIWDGLVSARNLARQDVKCMEELLRGEIQALESLTLKQISSMESQKRIKFPSIHMETPLRMNAEDIPEAPNARMTLDSPLIRSNQSPQFADGGRGVSLGGWRSSFTGTPVQVDIRDFLLSEKKVKADDYEELTALYSELRDEAARLHADDWMYRRSYYSIPELN